MLHLILGTLGCGKTTYLHRLIGQFLQNGGQEPLLLVPEQFTHESDVGLLSELGTRLASQVETVSFERLPGRLAEKYAFSLPVEMDVCTKNVLMSLSVRRQGEFLNLYRKRADDRGFIAAMVELSEEFSMCDVDTDRLQAVGRLLGSGALKAKLDDIALLLDTYEGLKAQRFPESTATSEFVCQVIQKTKCMQGRTVFLDGFRRFTAQQMKILSLIFTQSREVYACFCVDRLDSREEQCDAFTSLTQTVQRLMRCAAQNGVKCAKPLMLKDSHLGFSTYLSGELRYLEQNLYVADALAWEGSAENLTVCSALTMQQECEYTARTIKELLKSGAYRCRDIAVVYRREGEYDKPLTAALKKYGIPVFEDKRQPIVDQPLICYVRNLLQLCADRFDTDTLMNLAKTPLSPLDISECSELENYAYLWDIRGGQWLKDFTGNPDGFGVEMDPQRQQSLDRINEYRKALVSAPLAFREAAKDRNGRDFSALIYQYIIENGIDKKLSDLSVHLFQQGHPELAKEQQQVYEILMQILDRLACALGEEKVDKKTYLRLFEMAVASQSLGQIPEGFDRVSIGCATRLQKRMTRVVFALGMNEGIFPLPGATGGILTDAERLTLMRHEVETAKNSHTHALDEMFVVYNALCQAREKLYVCYSCMNFTGGGLQRSETVERILQLFPQCRKVTVSQPRSPEELTAVQPAFELLASHWHDTDVFMCSLKAYFENKQEYAGKIEALKRASEEKDFQLEDKALCESLFGQRLQLSASRVESFAKCPFQYFCKYGLGAFPRQAASLDAAQSGTVVHYVLERLLRQNAAKSIGTWDEERCRQEVQNALQAYVDSFMGGMADKSPRFRFLMKKMENTLCIVVRRLGLEFLNGDFEPCAFELPIGFAEKVKPYTLTLPKGRKLHIFGIIDRVDRMDIDGKTYLRVVDYKTGTREFYLSDVLNGLNMQMLLYLLSLCESPGAFEKEKVYPAGILYLPAALIPFDAPEGKTDQQLRQIQLEKGKMNGMLLNDMACLSGMTADGGMFVPVKVDKNGKLTGNLIDILQWGKLKEKIDRILCRMAQSLYDGQIAARPVLGKNYDKICDHCDYKSVCCHEKNGQYRFIEFLKHDDCLAALEEEV